MGDPYMLVKLGNNPLSLRAKGVAISSQNGIVRAVEDLIPMEIAELVSSVSEESLLPVCFGYALQPLALLAMT